MQSSVVEMISLLGLAFQVIFVCVWKQVIILMEESLLFAQRSFVVWGFEWIIIERVSFWIYLERNASSNVLFWTRKSSLHDIYS